MQEKNIKQTERELSVSKFGTWFSKDATPEKIIAKCEARLLLMEEWKKNLTTYKEEKEAIVLEQKKTEMKKLVSSMSSEEKAELMSMLEA